MISTTASSVTFTGNGITTMFPYAFPILQSSHLRVSITYDPANPSTSTVILSPSRYTTSGIGGPSGGYVSYPNSGTPLPNSQTITIQRIVPYQQGTSLTNQGGFYPQVIETALDYLTMGEQQLSTQLATVQAAVDAVNTAKKIDAPYVSPLEFGAKYDGVTDDTQAHIQAANKAVAFGMGLLLPAGTTVLSQIAFPAVKSFLGQGSGLTTIILKPGSYAGSILSFTGSVNIGGFSVSIAGASLVANNLLAFTQQTIANDIVIDGEFYTGLLFNGCPYVRCSNCVVGSTSAGSYIGIYATGMADCEIFGCRVYGPFTSHFVQVGNSTNSRVYSNMINGVSLSAFGISLASCTGCSAWGNVVYNSQYEGMQMTDCTFCSIHDNYVSWNGAGQDMGISMNDCFRCRVVGNSIDNSYAAAVGIACDAGNSFGNDVLDNYAHNCGVRITTALGTPYVCAGFSVYSGAGVWTNGSNRFSGNTIDLGTGKTVTYGYVETQATGVISNNRVEQASFRGLGVTTEKFHIVCTGSYVWMSEWVAWTPVVTTGVGTITTLGSVVGLYTQIGKEIRWTAAVFITTNGTGSGALHISLPRAPGTVISTCYGRECGVTGKVLTGQINSGLSTIDVNDATGAYPGANGAVINIQGSYLLP